jgi:uncharacterized membrane protein
MLVSWLHLISLAVYLGALAGLWLILLPALATVPSHSDKVKLLARGLKLYNPLQTAALGVLILSGAFQLTALKAAFRELFLKELGAVLAWKLTVSFFLIILSAYQSMALAHRFVRRVEGGEPFSPEDLQSLSRRLKGSTLAICLLAAVTIWLGLRLRS